MLKFFKRLFCEHDYRIVQMYKGKWVVDREYCFYNLLYCRKCGKTKIKYWGFYPKHHGLYTHIQQMANAFENFVKKEEKC